MKPNTRALFVRWLDACSKEGWTDDDEPQAWAEKPIEAEPFVGYVVYACADHIALSPMPEQDNRSSIWKIPRGCIIELRNAIPGPRLSVEDVMGPPEDAHGCTEAENEASND